MAFLYLLLMVGFLILIFRFILFYTTKTTGMLVGSKHRDTECIVESRIAPPGWKNRFWVRFGSKAAKTYAMRRIQRLITYFQHTPLIEDETARKTAVETLRSVQTEWRSSSWSEIYPYKK